MNIGQTLTPTLTRPRTARICDDDPTVLLLASTVLEGQGWKIHSHSCPKEFKNAIPESEPEDLFLIDIEMPEISGLELCQWLKTLPNRRHIPVVVMTSLQGPNVEAEAFLSGAVDFINKPFSPQSLLARTHAHYQVNAHRRQIEQHRQHLQVQVQEKTHHIRCLQTITIFALTALCGERDQETGSHIMRTQLYVQLLGRRIRELFPNRISEETLEALYRYSPLHDIGKIGIPDRILLKPGRLEPSEFEVIKTHPIIGHRALIEAEKLAQASLPELDTAKRIILGHHERWDGGGYPHHLAGEHIPIEARIMAVADVYDALRCKRVYKDPMPHERARQILIEDSGKHFDPDLIEAFLALEDEFQTISEKHQTNPDELETTRLKTEART